MSSESPQDLELTDTSDLTAIEKLALRNDRESYLA